MKNVPFWAWPTYLMGATGAKLPPFLGFGHPPRKNPGSAPEECPRMQVQAFWEATEIIYKGQSFRYPLENK